MKRFVHGGNIYKFEGKQDIFSIIDASANINPFGMSMRGKASMLDHLDAIVHYPDPNCKALVTNLATAYNLPEDHILLGNGAAELIYGLTYCHSVKRIITVAPAFSEYEEGAHAAQIPVDYIFTSRENNFKLTMQDVENIDWEGTLFFVGNPNNPDGQLLDKEVFLALVEASKRKGYVAVDESFIDFIGDTASYRQYVKKYKNLFIIHSFTKFFAVPGLRIGALFAHPETLAKVSCEIPSWSVNTMAQYYMLDAINDRGHIDMSRYFILKEKERVYQMYKALKGLDPICPSVNFMLIEIKDGATVEDLQSHLETKGILIRNAKSYVNLEGEWFRIAIKDKMSNDKIYEAIKEYLYG